MQRCGTLFVLDDGTMHVLTCGTPEQPASQHPNLPLQASIEKTVEPCSPMQTHVLLSKSTPLPRPNSAPRFRASPAPYPLRGPQDTARQGKTRPPVGSAAAPRSFADCSRRPCRSGRWFAPPAGRRTSVVPTDGPFRATRLRLLSGVLPEGAC